MECGLGGDGELVGSHAQAALLLEPIDAAFDRVALLVRIGIKGGQSATGTATPLAVTDLVRRLRDDGTDPAPAETASDRAGRILTVRQDSVRPSPRSSRPSPRNTDTCHDSLEGRGVARLTGGDAKDQGRAWLSLARRTFVLRPPRERPPFPGSSGMLMDPADGGNHRNGPANVVTAVRCCQNRREDPFPGSIHGSPHQPFASGLERSEVVWQVSPGRAGAVLPCNRPKGAAMIGPASPMGRIGRHQRRDPVPHHISDH